MSEEDYPNPHLMVGMNVAMLYPPAQKKEAMMSDPWKDARVRVEKAELIEATIDEAKLPFLPVQATEDVRTVLDDADALLAVVRAARYEPTFAEHMAAGRWSRSNFKVVGDYATIQIGMHSYLNGVRRTKLDTALAALPEHLRAEESDEAE